MNNEKEINRSQTEQPPDHDTEIQAKGNLMRSRMMAVIFALILAVVVLGVAFAVVKPEFFHKENSSVSTDVNVDNQDNSQTSDTSTTTSDTTSDLSWSECSESTVQVTRKLSGQVVWNNPEVIGHLDIFSPEQEYTSENSIFYKVGTVSNGKYTGGDIILGNIAYEGPAFHSSYYRMVKLGSEFILLQKYCDYYPEYSGPPTKFTIDNDFVVSDLEYPEVITGPNGVILEKEAYLHEPFCNHDFSKINRSFTHPTLGDAYTDSLDQEIDVETMHLPGTHGFYFYGHDGTETVYSLKIPFAEDYNVPQVVWNDGTKNSQEYRFTDVGGCGSVNLIAVQSPSFIKPSDLVKIGETSNNEAVYGLKDENHSLLRRIYDVEYYVYTPGEEKISYEDFVKAYPVFFWYDPFGRLIKFQNSRFVYPAECGKPVIYLYPQVQTDVSVEVRPTEGISYSDPEYADGWHVIAKPSGELTNKSDGQIYPYLFWEGSGGLYDTPKKGFVVAVQNVPSFLVEKLSLYGLSEKEINDFKEFWLPRMQSSPYYFVTFLDNLALDILAPLAISPKPDTIIRVLMDFKPLEKPIEVEGFRIPTRQRNGFTVVEWGGVLRGE